MLSTRPTWKSLSDRFKKIVGDHLLETRENEAKFGILEIRVEREELLEDINLAMDE